MGAQQGYGGSVRGRFENAEGIAGGGAPAALLHDMGELVGQQHAALGRGGAVEVLAEYDVGADGIGQSTDGTRGCGGRGVAVNLHGGKIVTQARLNELAAGGIEGMAGGMKHLAHDGRRRRRRRCGRRVDGDGGRIGGKCGASGMALRRRRHRGGSGDGTARGGSGCLRSAG
jgi:hypothetical protein